MTNSKSCRVCKQLKLNSNFRSNGKYTRSECRDCEKELARKRRKDNPEAQVLADKKYHAKNPYKRKEFWDSYYKRNKNKILASGRQYREENCEQVLAMWKSYRQENKAKIDAYSKEYRKKNPEVYKNAWHKRRDAIKASSSYLVTGKDVKKILQKPCFYCGSLESLSLEHVIPISRGGLHKIGNLVSACKSCNSRKNNKFITEWKRYA